MNRHLKRKKMLTFFECLKRSTFTICSETDILNQKTTKIIVSLTVISVLKRKLQLMKNKTNKTTTTKQYYPNVVNTSNNKM